MKLENLSKNIERFTSFLVLQNLQMLKNAINQLESFEAIFEFDSKKLEQTNPDLKKDDYLILNDRVNFEGQNIAILNETIAQLRLNLDNSGFEEREVSQLLQQI